MNVFEMAENGTYVVMTLTFTTSISVPHHACFGVLPVFNSSSWLGALVGFSTLFKPGSVKQRPGTRNMSFWTFWNQKCVETQSSNHYSYTIGTGCLWVNTHVSRFMRQNFSLCIAMGIGSMPDKV